MLAYVVNFYVKIKRQKVFERFKTFISKMQQMKNFQISTLLENHLLGLRPHSGGTWSPAV
jgi:hypothetical protein